jgi:hypothetical protein
LQADIGQARSFESGLGILAVNLHKLEARAAGPCDKLAIQRNPILSPQL